MMLRSHEAIHDGRRHRCDDERRTGFLKEAPSHPSLGPDRREKRLARRTRPHRGIRRFSCGSAHLGSDLSRYASLRVVMLASMPLTVHCLGLL
jgi:hypothetical protein